MKPIITIVVAALLVCLIEVSAMADTAVSFEADLVGGAPKGWIATKTGGGESKWTIEQDPRHPRTRRS